MNASELAVIILEWERAQKLADALKETIETEVLALGKTQVVGNVRVTYSEGRKTYDYETPGKAQDLPEAFIADYSKTIVDWRGICKALNVLPVVTGQSNPTATVKLNGTK